MLDITELYGKKQTVLLTGQIGHVGILRILGHLRMRYPDVYRRFDPSVIDWVYNGAEGKISKQVSRVWRKQTGQSLTDQDSMQTGTIARYWSASGQVTCDVTDDFTWSSGDFGDRGSCFWWNGGTYRGAVYDADGSAIRTYRDEYGNGNGRAWILPCLTGQSYQSGDFDYIGEYREYVVFNQYGHYDMQTIAEALRIMLCARHMVPVSVDYPDCHVNGGVHYLITDRSAHSLYSGYYTPYKMPYDSSSYPTVDFEISGYSETRYCTQCQCQCSDGELYGSDYGDDESVCSECWSEMYCQCEHCETQITHDESVCDADGYTYCQYCYDHYVCVECDICGSDCDPDQVCADVRGYDAVCPDCMANGSVSKCDRCAEYCGTDDLHTFCIGDDTQETAVCYQCKRHYDYCELCGMLFPADGLSNLPGHLVCKVCAYDASECPNCTELAETAKYYDPSDLFADPVTLCDNCASDRFDLTRLVSANWPSEQTGLFMVCTECHMIPFGLSTCLTDAGLCPICAKKQRVLYVRPTGQTALIDYAVQMYRQYIDQADPDLTNADPVALLTGPITSDDRPLYHFGHQVGYCDPVCTQCDQQRVKMEYDYLAGDYVYRTMSRLVSVCANCVHVPSARKYPADGSADWPVWTMPTDINRMAGIEYPVSRQTIVLT